MSAARRCERCGRGFSKSNGCATGDCSEVHRGALLRLFPEWPDLTKGIPDSQANPGARGCRVIHDADLWNFPWDMADEMSGEIDNGQDGPEAPGTGA